MADAQQQHTSATNRCLQVGLRTQQAFERYTERARLGQTQLPVVRIKPFAMSIMRFLAANGLPLSLSDDPYFREMIAAAGGGFDVPHRTYFSDTVLPQLSSEAAQHVRHSVQIGTADRRLRPGR